MVERQLEDVVEVLGEQEGGVSAGPDHANIGRHHGEHRPAGQQISHREIPQSGPEVRGRHLGRQQDPLWLGGEGGGEGGVRDEEEPGEQPHQQGETAQCVEYQPPARWSTTGPR